MPNAQLSTLLAHSGLFHEGHRALADCHAVLEVFSQRPDPAIAMPFCHLMKSADSPKVAVVALGGNSYEYRDALKQRGYRWRPFGNSPAKKAWRIELNEADAQREVNWLNATVFRRFGAPVVIAVSSKTPAAVPNR